MSDFNLDIRYNRFVCDNDRDLCDCGVKGHVTLDIRLDEKSAEALCKWLEDDCQTPLILSKKGLRHGAQLKKVLAKRISAGPSRTSSCKAKESSVAPERFSAVYKDSPFKTGHGSDVRTLSANVEKMIALASLAVPGDSDYKDYVRIIRNIDRTPYMTWREIAEKAKRIRYIDLDEDDFEVVAEATKKGEDL